MGGGISYGTQKQKVSELRVDVSKVDCRSQENREMLYKLDGKMDVVVEQNKMILDRLK